MTNFDVFNGDADGLCALHQLRLATPLESTLVTGPKRDIALLERVDAQAQDAVTVLDVSLDVNRSALLALLGRGVHVHYFDHHGSGEVPAHPHLQASIEPLPAVCTAMLVDRWLGGAHRIWAVVGAFGDNMARPARQLATRLALEPAQVEALRALGECLNYNAYGDSIEDLLIHPAALYRLLQRYPDPFAFMAAEPVFEALRENRRNDLALAQRQPVYADLPHGKIMLMPDAAWSRRVHGSHANVLATQAPELAHAVLTPDRDGGYTVSVRAPLANARGADRLCNQFPGGGGRPAAAGINHLPPQELPAFVRAFAQAFGGEE